MRRFGLVAVVGVVVFVGLVSVFGAASNQAARIQQRPVMPSQDPYEGFQVEHATPQTTRPGVPAATRIAGPNEPAMIVGDANEIRLRLKKHEGLELAIRQVEDKGLAEEREWTQMPMDSTPGGEAENRLQLVRAVKAQMKEELMLLRQLAAEEKAEKTLAAIDGLLLSRQGRFAQVIQRIVEEEARIAAREEAAQRSAGTAPGSGRAAGRRGAVQQWPNDQTMQGGAGANQPQRGTTRRRR